MDDFGGRSRCLSKIHDEGHNHFSWAGRDDVCWVAVNHVLSLIETVSSQSAGALRCCLSEKEFDSILKFFENFSVGIFYFVHCFLL